MTELKRISVRIGDHHVMTYSLGSGPNVLLVVHGGPGVPSPYVRDAHLRYADEGYRVVSWDQLGCGESDRPDDESLWTVSRYVEEMEAVRDTLKLGKVSVVGNSWGAALGLEYCIAYPENVKCYVAGNMGFNMPLLQQGFVRVKGNLGEETIRMMALRESEGTTDHPEYRAAVAILLHRHMCRMEAWPQSVEASLTNLGRGPLQRMFGPHLFNCTGNLREWDRMGDLHRVKTPTLITASEHDYLLPEYVCMARQYMPNASHVIFRNCAHMPFWEDPAAYHRSVGSFLSDHR